MRYSSLLLCIAAIAFGASIARGTPRKKHSAQRDDGPSSEALFSTNDKPVSPKAKVFLVAGSSQAASFAEEVVAQRALWLSAGFAEDEIECYFVVPLDEDLQRERKQFTALVPSLAPCHISSVKRLRSDLEATAAHKPELVYVYLTSHGDRPVSETLREARRKDRDYADLVHMAKFSVFDKYQLLVEGMPDGTATTPELIGALRAGMDPDALFLTPASLRKSLATFGQTPKVVVMQGCFSGGFFDEGSLTPEGERLSMLPDITLLSASRHDRSSFGCEPGVHATYFGGVYRDALAKRLRRLHTSAPPIDPRSLDWKALFDEVYRQVGALERRRRMRPPSEPQFFSNHKTAH